MRRDDGSGEGVWVGGYDGYGAVWGMEQEK